MPIDLGQVSWLYVAVLAVFAFAANFVANLLSFSHRWVAAMMAAMMFSAMFVFWTYYPHGLPLPISISGQKTPVRTEAPVAPVAPAIPQRPRNPVRDITPPPDTSQ